MKINIISKFLLVFVFSIFQGISLYAQEYQGTNAYKAEEQGYFTNPVPCSQGVFITDNYASKIWLLKDNNIEELISGPGCGRYFNVSPDGNKLGYKKIDENGNQTPAVYDLVSGQTSLLSNAVSLCGQVDFTVDATVFTLGNEIHILKNGETEIIPTDFYTNIVSLSPDGKYIACNDAKDHIVLISVDSKSELIISPKNTSSCIPLWSPDSKKVLISTSGSQLFVYELSSALLYPLGPGLNARWSPQSDKVVFYCRETNGSLVINSDIWLSDFQGIRQENLTKSSTICEMDPCFIADNEFIYHTYARKEICQAKIDLSNFKLVSSDVIFAHVGNPDIKFYNTASFSKNKTIVTVPGTVPYIHQVYDTPDWHYGYGSCAPTSAMMAIAYFNKLPKWPITSSWPTPHTSDYGNYIADKYRFNEIYYSDVATTGGGEDAWGGYGYMWKTGNSPNADMNQYMINHQLASNEHWDPNCKWDSTVHEINFGWPQPICSLLTTAGHLTLAIGYIVGQHTLIFQDPYGNKNNGYMNYLGQNAYYDWPGYNNGFMNLNTVAWTVKADGFETTYNDTIIDDIDYNHGFYMYNQPPSHMRYFRDETSSCYNNHYWYTYSNPSTTIDTCWVSWTPTLSQSSLYEVFVYIPGTYATATSAKYHIYFAGGDTVITIDQSGYGNAWVSLGIYNFNAGTSGYVRLSDATGIQGQYIAFDAMKWQKVVTTTVAEQHEDFGISVFPNPMHEEAFIKLSLDKSEKIKIDLMDVAGRKVQSLSIGLIPAGDHTIKIELKGISAGSYFFNIKIGDQKVIKKIIVY
jgi:hypothetical protein